MYKFFCDRCGKETEEKYIAKLGKIDSISFFGEKKYSLGMNFDLCRECYDECKAFFLKKKGDGSA